MKRTMAKMLQRAKQHHRGEAVVRETAASPLAEKVANRATAPCDEAVRGSCAIAAVGIAARLGGAGWDDPESGSSVIRVEDTILFPVCCVSSADSTGF